MSLTANAESVVGRRTRPWWRRAASGVVTAATIALALYLWPAMLGGDTRLVVVSGHSMEPTYDLGDIVIARDTDDTEIGDIVVFEVPDGNGAGLLVIHRVVAIDGEGRFITQGDNRNTLDDWPLTEADIVGEPLVHVPKAGVIMAWFRDTRVLAAAAGLMAVLVLWPSRRPGDTGDDESDERDHTSADADEIDAAEMEVDEIDAGEIDAAEIDADVMEVDEIDAEVMAEALAWLDEQLAATAPSVGQPSSS